MNHTIVKELSNRSVKVTFTKKDGSERTMNCTRSSDLIPSINMPAGNKINESENQVRVFDLDQRAWRSFIIESVISYE